MRMSSSMAKQRVTWKRSVAFFALCFVMGCTHFKLDDCPESGVLGKDTPRMRTSHYRVQLANTAAAANRFVPYAMMAAYAYRDGKGCNADETDNPLASDAAAEIERFLTTPNDGGAWTRASDLGLPGDCEDGRGLLFHVWTRPATSYTEVVIAFRGTSGVADWIYGNAWWLTRFVNEDDQYKRARTHTRRILDHFKRELASRGLPEPRFISTGHSLGGGLAQHVLYAYPTEILQAIAFAPSSVTGFVAVGKREQRDGCACRKDLKVEGRLIRIYESYEVLSNLRIFHKIFFPPERHVQEVRFPFKTSFNPIARHNMLKLAKNLRAASADLKRSDLDKPWYASRETMCTQKLEDAQARSCLITPPPDARFVCPQ